MRGLYLIPNRAEINEFVELANAYGAYYEYNDFVMGEVLDDKKKQAEIIDFYAKVRNDFS